LRICLRTHCPRTGLRVLACLAWLSAASTAPLFAGVGDQQPPAPAPAAEADPIRWQVGASVDGAYAKDFNSPANHLFRNRGTTPRVDEFDLNMAAAYIRKLASDSSRWAWEVTGHAGQDSKAFGFSPTAPNIAGASWLTHLGPTNVSYVAPAGRGVTLQAGIFNSLIGYDSLYAKDNVAYTRPWGADYTPYLMMGVNASYPLTKAVTGTFGIVNGYWHLAHANDVPSFVGQLAVNADEHVTIKQAIVYGPHQSDTGVEFWRVLSDSIIERKADPVTVAFEYQLGAERVAVAGHPLALWMAAQLPVHWTVRHPWGVTVRPELAWDRDGRWIGAPQTVVALTTTVEYRVPAQRMQTIVRLEHRIDNSQGAGGGFFVDGDASLRPTQNLLTLAAIFTFDKPFRE
jgi:hypothetical protein